MVKQGIDQGWLWPFIFLLTGLTAVGCSTFENEEFMTEKAQGITLEIIARLAWNDTLELDIVDVEPPPDGSFLAVPGPRRRPTRPHLELFVGAHGSAARVLSGDGRVWPLMAVVKQTVTVSPLEEPPLALQLRQDGGVWVLNKTNLIHYDSSGRPVDRLQQSGITLVGSAENGVWVVGLDRAWFVEANGRISDPYPWSGGLGSAPAWNDLCALDKGKPRRIQCLKPDGQRREISMPSPVGQFERLLAVTDAAIFTLGGATLRRYEANGDVAAITIQAAGLTAAGEAFASGREGPVVNLWGPNHIPRRLPLPSDISPLGALPVVAVTDTQALAYGLGQAIWYKEDQIDRIVQVDEDIYRNQIFPQLWSLGGVNFVGVRPDGVIVLTATGPAGIILIAFHGLT